MTTFQSCWSSFEWQPLICYHPFDKLSIMFCAFSNRQKSGNTSCQIGFFKTFESRNYWYFKPFVEVWWNHYIANFCAILVVDLSRLIIVLHSWIGSATIPITLFWTSFHHCLHLLCLWFWVNFLKLLVPNVYKWLDHLVVHLHYAPWCIELVEFTKQSQF